MLRPRLTLLALAAAALVSQAAAVAGTDSLRDAFVKDRPAKIDLEKDGIRADSYRFDRIVRGAGNPLKTNAGPTVVFNVKNEGTEKKDFGIAVALFDTTGRLVAAGTGSRGGKLDAGKNEELKVVFRGVSRDVARAATIYMTLETER